MRPKRGQVLFFEEGAVLSGSQPVTGWRRQGRFWVSSGHRQNFSDAPWLSAYKCDNNPSACIYEDVFLDDSVLTHVQSPAELGEKEVYLDRSRGEILLAVDPRSHQVEATVARVGISSDADRVSIRGGRIEKFAWMGMQVLGDSWVIEDVEIRQIHATGLRMQGDGHRVTDCFLHHNGNTGLVATHGSDLLFENNEVAFNNTFGFGSKPVPHHEGGVKMLLLSDVVVTGNHSHHNDGDGWWFDSSNTDVLVEDNVFEANSRYGFFYEVSYRATIRSNVLRENGSDAEWQGGGLRIASSSDVEIAENLFEDNGYSTLFVNWTDRGSGASGEFQLRNLHVHDNVFTLGEGWVGSSYGSATISDPSFNNRFERNTYQVPDGSDEWWTWQPQGFIGWGEWQALGFDTEGELTELEDGDVDP